jgi:RND superfamily putative drug exporter
MKLDLSTAGLARASAQHPVTTIGAWIGVLAIAVALIGALLGDALALDITPTNNSESLQAETLLQDRLQQSNNTIDEIVIVRSTTRTVDDPAYRSFVEDLYADLAALGGDVIAGGPHYYRTGEESQVSADRRTTIMPLVIPEGARNEIERVHQVVDRAGESGSFQVLIAGDATLDAEITKIAEKDLMTGEVIGISVALVVLVLVFGAVAAALLPIVMAIAAIVVALGATALIGQAYDLPFFVTNMITMMGLAVGIDYSLFIVSRYRDEQANGLGKVDAIAATGATAGRTVLFSGMTVGLALVGLLITPDSANKAIGIGALLVVVAAVLASMTLLPALLSLMGDKVNAIRLPLVQRRRIRQPSDVGAHEGSAPTSDGRGFWDWSSRAIMRRPVVGLVVAAGVLLAAASSYVDLNQGEIGVSALPDGLRSKEAFVVLQDEFGFGQDLPAVVVIDGRADSVPVQAAIRRVEAAIASDPAFARSDLEVHPDVNLSILRARLAGDPASERAMEAVRRLRADHIRNAFDGVPARALVTGETAAYVDLAEINDTYTPIVLAFVLGLSFVLLTVAFRSIVIPVKAILMNLLSVGATYGLLVLVFQKGVGADLFGFQQVDVIQTGLPLFLFAVLFGLSMDYHVFLLSRIRERFMQTGDNNEAVAFGLRSTGRLISGAALIMVAVFGGFALGDLVAMQQFGFGLAVAVLLDATIVRLVLVPASMRLLGDWNWYLPQWLEWLPNVALGEGGSEAAQPAGQPTEARPAYQPVSAPVSAPADD